MSLAAGERLGSYEIVGLIGAGGMGEVYRALDPSLQREVAIKILPAGFAADPDRLRRFELEARAAGSLNHPNILVVYAFGTHEGSPYVVSELLEGEPLGTVLRNGPLPKRKIIDYGAQIARGLAAAHQKNIVHRDIKPANLFLTTDGRVKILDFGLAKLVQPAKSPENSSASTEFMSSVFEGTDAGVVMGTVGYMSPEQVRAQTVDHRADIFSFGIVLHEMATGARAFKGGSAVEIMNAILKEDAPAIEDAAMQLIVRHCLEKNPEERFQSARDIAFNLEALAGGTVTGLIAEAPLAHRRKRRIWGWPAAALVFAAAIGGAYFAGTRVGVAPSAESQEITFRRGNVVSARFAPDGNTILYGASWEGSPVQIFAARLDSPESRPLGLTADVLSASATGELAISLGRHYTSGWMNRGKLARVPLAGGAPREVLDDLAEADWDPAGTRFSVVRQAEGKYRLEYPPGKILFETDGWISHARISPAGDRIAFIEHPALADDQGMISMVDLKGSKTTLTSGFSSAQGLAWTPSGNEIWFTASDLGYERRLRAVTPEGRSRVVAMQAGTITLHDISRQGRVLFANERIRMGAVLLAAGTEQEKELTWLDGSIAFGLSPDGKLVTLNEEGAGGGKSYSVYIRKSDGSDAVRLGEGVGGPISVDGKWVAALAGDHWTVLPAGAGEARILPKGNIVSFVGVAVWLHHSGRLVTVGNEKGRAPRAWLQDLAGEPEPITPEVAGSYAAVVSPDDQWLALSHGDGKVVLYPLMGGREPRVVPGTEPADNLIEWSEDGGSLYLSNATEQPVKIVRLDLASGKRQTWRTIRAQDPVGITTISPIQITPDGKTILFSYTRVLSDLYVMDYQR